MATTADPPETDEQSADSATEDSSEEPDPDPFEKEVQRYLDEGMSVPAIASEVADHWGVHISAYPKYFMRYSPNTCYHDRRARF